jgi:hypothetical protein
MPRLTPSLTVGFLIKTKGAFPMWNAPFNVS